MKDETCCPKCEEVMELCFTPTNSKLRVWRVKDFDKRKGVYLNVGVKVLGPAYSLFGIQKIKFHPTHRCSGCEMLLLDYGTILRAKQIKAMYQTDID
jgi:hypothetical protein